MVTYRRKSWGLVSSIGGVIARHPSSRFGLFDINTFSLLLSCVWIDYLTHSLHPWIQSKCRCILTWIIPVEVKTWVSSWISSSTQCLLTLLLWEQILFLAFAESQRWHLLSQDLLGSVCKTLLFHVKLVTTFMVNFPSFQLMLSGQLILPKVSAII